MSKVSVGVLGTGNIGTDLCYKLLESPHLDLRLFAGIDPQSDGLARGKEMGVPTSSDGLDAILESDDIEIVIDATSAKAHAAAAPRLREAGKFAIDLTPAAVGPYVVPVVNLDASWDLGNVNLISCAAQATIPIFHAISRIAPIKYGEIASAASSRGAGPGTRQNIDEFTRTTTRAIMQVGGAKRAKTIMALNPADPPILMRNTIYAQVEGEVDRDEIASAIQEMVARVQSYVPGYTMKIQPIFEDDFVTVGVEVEGAGDYLPKYAGNLDIMTAAGVAVAEKYAMNKADEKNSGGTL